jgi:hypothetical protein
VPKIVDKYLNSDMTTTAREGTGAALLCYMYSDALSPADESEDSDELSDETEAENMPIEESESVDEKTADDWQGFNVSRWEALKALDEVDDVLGDFHINTERNPMRVVAPSGNLYQCPR